VSHLLDLFKQFLHEVPAILRESKRTAAELDNYHDFHRLAYDWLEEQETT
jgi:hypothetical protein